MKRLLHRVGLDRAVSLGLATRVWSLLAGPVSVLLIAANLSREQQGYYYTFASLLVLQTFLELGLGTVIIQFASHEWAHLQADDRGGIVGPGAHLARLASLARFSARWYGIAAPTSAVGLSIAGYIFFAGSHPVHDVHWVLPWIALCLISAATLALLPYWSLLEGCNQIEAVYMYRLWSAVLTNVVTWAAVASGAGLWAPALALGSALLLAVGTLLTRFGAFFRSLFRAPVTHAIAWREEILPLQWRIGASWLSGYFVYQFFTPLSFRLYGPAVAGQVGMTWGLVSAVLATSYTWVAAKSPTFGVLIARNDRTGLDRLFFRATTLSFAAATAGAVAVVSVTAWLYSIRHALSGRLLAPLPTATFLVGTIMSVVVWSLIAYGRAHKQEPFLAVSVGGALLTPAFALLLGRRWGVTGLAMSHVGVIALQLAAAIPIFVRKRALWSRTASSPDGEPAVESALTPVSDGYEPITP